VIVLDTNVISELTRQVPEPGVISWLDSLPAEEVGTTAVTAAELLYGVTRMPAGRRKTELAEAVRGLLGDDFRDRVLPFDEHCASRYADIVCGREALGRLIGVADAQIAAICRTAEATLATRNTDDFSGTGIELINPWKLDRPEPA
jgi:predicted nucleic acid-binding protein